MPFKVWMTDRLADRGLTVPQFATRIGVAKGTVYAWVEGRALPQVPSCRRIAAGLSLDPREVMGAAGMLPPEASALLAQTEYDLDIPAAIRRRHPRASAWMIPVYLALVEKERELEALEEQIRQARRNREAPPRRDEPEAPSY